MIISKVCSPLLMTSAMFLIACGGSTTRYQPKHPEIKSDTVTITKCDANPDMVDVYDGQTLTWKVNDADTYTITFSGSSPVPINVSQASSSSPDAQTIHKTWGCRYGGWLSDNYCKYDYSLKNGTSTVCPDPGIHIIPGS